MCDEKNVMCKEKGLEAAFSFFDRCEHPKRNVPVILSSVVESLGGRPKTLSAAQDLLMLLIEVDQPEPVIVWYHWSSCVYSIERIGERGWKQTTQDSCCFCLNYYGLSSVWNSWLFWVIYSVFGIKSFPTKTLLKVFPKWFEHTNPTVRDAAQSFTVELSRWVGIEFLQKPYLESLRETQVRRAAMLVDF